MTLCFIKVSFYFIVLSISCIHLSVQQFGFDDYDYGFGFHNAPAENPNTNRQIQSNLKINNWLPPGQELVFSRGGNNGANVNTGPTTSGNNGANLNKGSTGGNNAGNFNTGPTASNNGVNINSSPPPFMTVATTPPPGYFQCLQRCPTTSEYNPVCASNRQMYGNEQKFNCARQCGANIQIVRRTSCQGIVQMQRG